jgi:Glycosyl hydrolase family 65, C-terminal domain/F5/8 type C domain
LRPRADNIIEVNPLVPDAWNYFALDDVAYHGHRLSVIWDRDGTRYSRGKGLMIFVDGRKIADSPRLGRLTGTLPATLPATAPVARLVNYAVNNDGQYFPKIRTTYTAPFTSAGFLSDGTYFYNQGHPRNRWTTQGSPNKTDAIDLDFGTPRPLEQVKLYLLDDGFGQCVRAPSSYKLEYWDDGQWQSIPGQKRTPETPEGHRPNVITFPKFSAARIRVVLTPRPFLAVGLTELEAWGPCTMPLTQPHLPAGDLALQAKASASYTWTEDSASAINDGIISMSGGPRNRWTAYKTPNPSDWLQLDFPSPVTVGRMEICFWADNGVVQVPQSYKILYWNGSRWADVNERSRNPRQPTLLTSNEVTIDPVKTTRLRLILVHGRQGPCGVTEWMVWNK